MREQIQDDREIHWLLRSLRIALGRAAAFFVGAAFEDERTALSAHALVQNDAYRDRLLAAEIVDLVALSDALRLAPGQRRALFQCFLYVDCWRRAGVSRAELLRYCDLHASPLSAFLLPAPTAGATHRDGGHGQRWDVLQWVAVCFSVCTLEFDAVRLGFGSVSESESGGGCETELAACSVQLIATAIAAACRSEGGGSVDTDLQDEKAQHGDVDERTQREAPEAAVESSTVPSMIEAAAPHELTLCDEIERCFAFFIGVLGPHELHLQQLLCEFYSTAGSSRVTKEPTQAMNGLDVRQAHAVNSVLDVAKLFPGTCLPLSMCAY